MEDQIIPTHPVLRQTFFESQMGKALLKKNQEVAVRRSRSDRRIAEKAGALNLPKPIEKVVSIVFDPHEGVFELDGAPVFIDRASDGGYQRDYDDLRARMYGSHFDWGLYGRPLLNRRDDGTLWVVAGQHRLPAAAYAGHEAVPIAIYDGLTRQQEAYLFNQEATQRRNLTALNKFHSGVQSGFPDHVVVQRIVESLGGQIAQKSSPRSAGDTGGSVVAVNDLLDIYDYAGAKILYDALYIIKEGWGSLTGKGIDGGIYKAMALMVGIYSTESEFGTMNHRKMIDKMQRSNPLDIRSRAIQYTAKGRVPSRFHALVDFYNHKTFEKNKLEEVRPDWRKASSSTCVAPGCTTGPKGKPGRAYRRNLCRRHYEASKTGENVAIVS